MKGVAIQLEPSDTPKVLRPVFNVFRDSFGKITNGLTVGQAQYQNEALLLISNAGEYKNAPLLGIGLENALLSDTNDLLRYRHAARRNYALDGMEITEMRMFKLNEISIKAKYK